MDQPHVIKCLLCSTLSLILQWLWFSGWDGREDTQTTWEQVSRTKQSPQEGNLHMHLSNKFSKFSINQLLISPISLKSAYYILWHLFLVSPPLLDLHRNGSVSWILLVVQGVAQGLAEGRATRGRLAGLWWCIQAERGREVGYWSALAWAGISKGTERES